MANTMKLTKAGNQANFKISVDLMVDSDPINVSIEAVMQELESRAVNALANIGNFAEVSFDSKGDMKCIQRAEPEDSDQQSE